MMYRKDEIKMNRERSGIKVGALGAAGNIVLFIIKFIMGSMANSIAIIADSFNNLVDCTSSVITIAGFISPEKDAMKSILLGADALNTCAALLLRF